MLKKTFDVLFKILGLILCFLGILLIIPSMLLFILAFMIIDFFEKENRHKESYCNGSIQGI